MGVFADGGSACSCRRIGLAAKPGGNVLKWALYVSPEESSDVFDLKPTSGQSRHGGRIRGMATIPELLDGHVTLEAECLVRLYLNGYIGELATGLGLVMFKWDSLPKRVPAPVVLEQISEKFREAVKAL